MYLSPILFILSAAVYAVYNYYSIRCKTNTWKWHVYQWLSVAMFLLTGMFFGRWSMGFNFHDFGELAAVGVLAVPVYITVFRYMQKKG